MASENPYETWFYGDSDGGDANRTRRLTPDERIRRFPQRLQQSLGRQSVKAFARKSGVSEGTLHSYLRGKTSPDIERVGTLAMHLGVSPEWLLVGDEESKDHLVAEGRSLYCTREESEFSRIPAYDVRASAGDGAYVDEEQRIGDFAFRRDWLREKGLQEKDLALVRADGDSMEPAISDGDLLLVDMSQKSLAKEGIFVVRLDDRLVAKRLQLDFTGGVYIKSENPAYETIHLGQEDRERLDVVGRVVWAGVEFD